MLVLLQRSFHDNTLEKNPEPGSWLPLNSSGKEIATASRASAQAFGRPVAVLSLHLIGLFFRDDVHIIVVHVLERQFRPCGDGLGREEGEVVNVDVGVVVGDGVDGAVGVAGMVDEASGTSEMHAVADILGTPFLFAPLVKFHQVDLLVHVVRLAAAVGFVVGDDFSAVGVDELASL